MNLLLKPALALALIAPLAACGADGAPVAPTRMDTPATGITLSGCVKAGVVAGPPVTSGSPARC
ncbi:argininosuccinate lyase [Tabrizicola oligotrophica]|uniref:Argininosuccinate lyase n=1 Tax=Tabrizicola oligotrophica TaxID=2710650 RepID=A0A6M0QV36_9RHOB|nr:argininosuccinate lyase [Tabrizicola oligotrophica]NEY90513.1 argininosuccinate lyase [Tabrizicola oligotrophica]